MENEGSERADEDCLVKAGGYRRGIGDILLDRWGEVKFLETDSLVLYIGESSSYIGVVGDQTGEVGAESSERGVALPRHI